MLSVRSGRKKMNTWTKKKVSAPASAIGSQWISATASEGCNSTRPRKIFERAWVPQPEDEHLSPKGPGQGPPWPCHNYQMFGFRVVSWFIAIMICIQYIKMIKMKHPKANKLGLLNSKTTWPFWSHGQPSLCRILAPDGGQKRRLPCMYSALNLAPLQVFWGRNTSSKAPFFDCEWKLRGVTGWCFYGFL